MFVKMKVNRLIAVVLCVSSLLTLTHTKKTKTVSMNLDAKWLDTPLLLEASEVLAEESNEKFWMFVNSIADLEPKSYLDNDQEAFYQLTLTQVHPLLSPLKLSLLKFALSVRAQSPRVEMFSQIGHSKLSPQSCGAFVDVNNLVTCDLSALDKILADAQGQPKPLLVKSDHHYPSTQYVNTTVILYAEVGTQGFLNWHQVLKPRAEWREINYILRHYITNPEERPVRLSGYGVELAIKSQEYKAKDDTKVDGAQQGDGQGQAEEEDEEIEIQGFAFKQLKTIHPKLDADLEKFRQHLLTTSTEMPELKVWELQDLSFQAAQKVMTSPDDEKLRTLRDISQNFPLKTTLLIKTSVSDTLRKEIKKNQQTWEQKLGLGAGDSALFINGIQADLDVYDVFTLMETMGAEAKLMEGLHTLGLQGSDLTDMLKIEIGDTDSNYAVDFRGSSVVWLNNLEKDRRYQGWPASLTELLRPAFPGMLRHIRKNMFNVVFMVDPSDIKHRELLKMAEAFYVHSAPVRIGVVFVVNPDLEVDGATDAGVALMRAFNYLSKEEQPIKGLEFITEVYSKAESEEVTPDHVMATLNERRPHVTRESLLGDGGRDYDKNRAESVSHFASLGLGELPQVLINGVPMKKEELDSDNFEEALVSTLSTLTPQIQRAVYNGFLYDGMDILEYLMTRSNVMPRLNSRVLSPGTNFLDFTAQQAGDVVRTPDTFQRLSMAGKTAAMAGSMKYLTKKEEPAIRSLTNWVVLDLDSVEGRALMYEAAKHLKSSSSVRLGVIHNPTTLSTQDKQHSIAKAVQVALETLPVTMAKSFITKLVKEENVEALRADEKSLDDLAVNNMDMTQYHKDLESFDILSVLASHRHFIQGMECEAGQRAVISNGKVIGPFKQGEVFTQEDFSLLEKYGLKTVAEKIEKKVKKMGLGEEKSSELIMRVAALLQSGPESESSRKETPYSADKHRKPRTITSKGDKHSVIHLPARDPDSPAYDVTAILDPTSRAAQKYTPLLMVLQELCNVDIRVFLNCQSQLSEMPLKSFYRYVLEPEVRFDPVTKMSVGPGALFQELPEKPILTLTLNTPESWLVESVKTMYDLDNIHLEEFESSVHADFELEYLLLEGHCFDASTSQPPRGLQFTLGTEKQPALVDTIVMANLGYFQLKASPGVWDLKLRHGRSQEIYEIASHDHTDSPPDSKDVLVVMDTLKSKIIKLRVAKKPGKQDEDLLSESKEEANGQGIWDTISSTLTGSPGETATLEEKDGTINIFSLASGHLYERFMRIMVLSVLKHTKSKVKFWFLKNYLSPSFKDFIPKMAEEYGFEVELVQYKWPRWLHQQTEKQRVMWGYKILFLDVLFPLNISKIIFVDADQIVRTDLKELVDFDLEGAPYGYTPFCDSRKEMDGFRFWKSGYWNSHLSGRRYHISALYVVDLKKFRKIAAGDRLRGQYQGLSQDPNSLSNLDQDLPNNMIHQVPIKSLPQEWLWCETWCSDGEKTHAKTIDLCNNPLTKEPKLTAAQRIVPEWIDYDNEAKALWDRVYKTKSTPEKPGSDEPPVIDSEEHKHREL